MTGHNTMYFLTRHAMFVLVSLFAAAMVFQVPLRVWQQAAPFLFLGGLGLLALVLVPGIGREVNGSRRWLSLFVINLQPSELMKMFVILYADDYAVRKLEWICLLYPSEVPDELNRILFVQRRVFFYKPKIVRLSLNFFLYASAPYDQNKT